MKYFNYATDFIKKNKKNSSLIFLLDLLFYFLLFLIPYFSLNLFVKNTEGLDYRLLGTLTQPGTADEVLTNLLEILFGFLGIIFLCFVLLLIAFAVIKGSIWLMVLKQKINWQKITKFLLLKFLLDIIFIIPFAFTLIPITSKTYVTDVHAAEVPVFSDLIPMIILSLIFIYFVTMAFYFMARENSVIRALKLTFTKGFTKLNYTALLFLGFYAIILLGIQFGSVLPFVVIILGSFANRIYITKHI